MAYSIHISDSNRFFSVVVDGETTAQQARQWAAELRDAGLKNGVQRFLFDVRKSRNISSVLDNYKFAHNNANELGLERNVRAAILVSPEDTSHDFVKVVMRNAGYNVNIFTDESSAVMWLEEGMS